MPSAPDDNDLLRQGRLPLDPFAGAVPISPSATPPAATPPSTPAVRLLAGGPAPAQDAADALAAAQALVAALPTAMAASPAAKTAWAETPALDALLLLRRRAPRAYEDAAEALRTAAGGGVSRTRLEQALRERQRAARAERPGYGGAGTGAAGAQDGRVVIPVSDDLPAMVHAAEGALVAAGAELYHRAGELVRVVRVQGQARIESVPLSALAYVVSAATVWEEQGRDGPKTTTPPRNVLEALQTLREWQLRPLRGVSSTPVLRADGTVLQEPGYDAASSLIYLPDAAFPTVPEWPSREQALAALEELYWIWQDVPFVAREDRAALLSLLLTVLGRQAIEGPVPMCVVSANASGIGKGLALTTVELIALGRSARSIVQTENEDEDRKRLTTLGMAGDALVRVDNVDKPLGGPLWDSILTEASGLIHDRALGGNNMVSVAAPVFAANGNNVQVAADMVRRFYLAQMRTDLERPDKRTGFAVDALPQYADLEDYVRQNRPRLVAAALTILRWHCAAGRPLDRQLPRMGSFGSWSRLVRGALWELERVDPLASAERLRADIDPRREAETELLRLWWADWTLRAHPISPRDLVDRANSLAASGSRDLQDAVRALAPRLHTPMLSHEGLGARLRRMQDCVLGGLRVERAAAERGWRLVRVRPEGEEE